MKKIFIILNLFGVMMILIGFLYFFNTIESPIIVQFLAHTVLVLFAIDIGKTFNDINGSDI